MFKKLMKESTATKLGYEKVTYGELMDTIDCYPGQLEWHEGGYLQYKVSIKHSQYRPIRCYISNIGKISLAFLLATAMNDKQRRIAITSFSSDQWSKIWDGAFKDSKRII